MVGEKLTVTVEEAGELLGISRGSPTTWYDGASCRASISAGALSSPSTACGRCSMATAPASRRRSDREGPNVPSGWGRAA
jgi:hypothetical protein